MTTNESTARVRIFDTTLRDGEQSPGCSMTPQQKRVMARALAELGVDIIETGFPASSQSDREATAMIARDLKHTLAGVNQELIDREGVVNELTALQMALGAQRRCGADWAVATTGVAGPTEVDGVKVGTVWFAVVGPSMGMSQAPQYTELREFEGDREAVRQAAISHAFEMLLRVL